MSVRKKVISEKAPQGWEGTVKAMKKRHSDEIDNPYALTHWMNNKGFKSHKKKTGGPVKESLVGIRVSHPEKGKGVVVNCTESYMDVRWENAQHRMMGDTRFDKTGARFLVQENTIRKPKAKKAKRLDERMIGMAPIGGTIRNTERAAKVKEDMFSGLSLDDLDFENVIFEEDEESTSEKKGKNFFNKSNDATDGDADDAILTSVESKPKSKGKGGNSLATMAGAESAKESNFDFSDDPSDAPKAPKVREIKKSKKMTEGKNTMSGKITWKDLGLLTEEFDQFDGDEVEMNEHDMGAGEIAVTQELMKELLMSVAEQSPDEAKIDAIVSGLATAASEDRTLDVADIGTIMDAIKSAFGGDADDADMDVDAEDDSEMDMEDDSDVETDVETDDDSDEAYSPGDGEEAGDEAGEEHEGKTKLFASEEEELEDDDELLDESMLNIGMGKSRGAKVANVGAVGDYQRISESEFKKILGRMKI